MQFDWIPIMPFDGPYQVGPLPPQKRHVLVQFRLADEERIPLRSIGQELITVHSPGVAVGFWIDQNARVKWVIPGLTRPGTVVTHYADVLGDDFTAAQWPWHGNAPTMPSKQVFIGKWYRELASGEMRFVEKFTDGPQMIPPRPATVSLSAHGRGRGEGVEWPLDLFLVSFEGPFMLAPAVSNVQCEEQQCSRYAAPGRKRCFGHLSDDELVDVAAGLPAPETPA